MSAERARLDVGGFTLRAERVPGVPLVSTRAFVRGGSRLEPSPGHSYLVGRLLGEGTSRRDYRQLAEEAESRGAWQQTFGSAETLGVVVDTLAADWRWALDRLLEMLLEPAFPEDRLDWLRRQVVAELDSLRDQPEARASQAFIDQLYAPHPSGRLVQGDAESLAGIDRDGCFTLHRRCLGWGGCLSIAGDVDPRRVVEHLAERLGDLDLPREAPPTPPAILGGEARRRVELTVGEQAHVLLGAVTAERDHPDYAALELLGVVLGSGGLSGRLPLVLREREGLAYHVDVATAAGAGLDPGRFVVYLGTSPRHAEKAEALIRGELDRLLADGVPQDELDEARGYLLGRAPFRLETLRQRAEVMAEASLYGNRADDPEWWPARLRAVEVDDLHRVARRWLRPDALKLTVGVPARRRAASETQ